jgi:hypothetical protein
MLVPCILPVLAVPVPPIRIPLRYRNFGPCRCERLPSRLEGTETAPVRSIDYLFVSILRQVDAVT